VNTAEVLMFLYVAAFFGFWFGLGWAVLHLIAKVW
jgi:hypothetical protein